MRLAKRFFGLGAVVLGFCCVAAYLAFRGISGPPVISIRNESSVPLTNVSVFDAGWAHLAPSDIVGTLAPGARVEFVLKAVKGESGATIAFMADGRKHHKAELGYIESNGGYCMDITINAQFEVRADGGPTCFKFRRIFN